MNQSRDHIAVASPVCSASTQSESRSQPCFAVNPTHRFGSCTDYESSPVQCCFSLLLYGLGFVRNQSIVIADDHRESTWRWPTCWYFLLPFSCFSLSFWNAPVMPDQSRGFDRFLSFFLSVCLSSFLLLLLSRACLKRQGEKGRNKPAADARSQERQSDSHYSSCRV